MKAKLVDYDCKYYGTKVEIYFSDEEDDFEEVIIWRNFSTEPSIRQIKRRDENLTQEDYDNNIEIESYIYHGEWNSIQDEIYPRDSHFETVESYEAALQLVNKINSVQKH